MKIAVDKNSYHAIKNDGNEYIYLFYDEPYSELKKLNMHCIRWNMCDYVDINATEYDIDCFKVSNILNDDWNIIPEKKNYFISIIIPNCDYSNWLPKCFQSILKQTYKNYEIIFVDDVSLDNSIEVAETYKKQFDKICNGMKIIKLSQKKYNGGSRNTAYLHLNENSDFIYYIDSDDWLMNENSLQKINNKLQKSPDVLFVGMSIYKNGRLSTACIPQYKDKYEAFVGWSGSCGKVIKKELATRQECLYNEGTLKEDKNQHCRICFYMNTFENLKEPVYVWNRENTKSVTTVREKIIWGTSTIRQYADTLQFALSIKGLDPKIDRLMDERVMMTKREMENGGDKQW